MTDGWRKGSSLVAAYSGTQAGAAQLVPATRALRRLVSSRLILLWPESMPIPTPIVRAVDAKIGYPASDLDARGARSSAVRAVAALLEAAPEGAVVFTERGHSPHLAAYLCSLAGVPRRAGFVVEFSGALLTSALSEPPFSLPDAERHLFLLEGLGFPRAPAGLSTRPVSPPGEPSPTPARSAL